MRYNLLYDLFCKKKDFHDICAFSKEKASQFHAFLCVRSKSLFLRVLVRLLKKSNFTQYTCQKNKISRILKLPSWQYCASLKFCLKSLDIILDIVYEIIKFIVM